MHSHWILRIAPDNARLQGGCSMIRCLTPLPKARKIPRLKDIPQ